MPIALCYGSRPQVIKAAPLARALARDWDVLTIDTAHHADAPGAATAAQLGLAPARVVLDAADCDPARQTAALLAGAAASFAEHSPRAVVVVGDTHATLACALAAAKMRIPLVHVEAGLRARDRALPEEINRRVVDALSDVLCAPSRIAETRLQSEGVDGRVVRTGDVARDALRASVPRAVPPEQVAGWPLQAGEPFFLATLQRADLVGDPARLSAVFAALAEAPFPVVLPLHRRTRECLTRHGLRGTASARVHLLPPLGYLEMLGCLQRATALVTDSGGAQRDAYWLGTPCVTLRRETEWTETVTVGANVLVPVEEVGARLPARLRQLAFGERRPTWNRDLYGDGYAADRVRDAVEACVGAATAGA